MQVLFKVHGRLLWMMLHATALPAPTRTMGNLLACYLPFATLACYLPFARLCSCLREAGGTGEVP